MEKTILNVKVNRDIKEEARELAKELGLPLSTIVNSFLKMFINDRRVEFVAHPMPNKKTQKLLDEIDKDIKEGKNLSGPFDDIEDAIKYLNS